MKTWRIWCFIVITFGVSAAVSFTDAANPKTLELQRKIADITKLRAAISAKIDTAQQMREHLKRQIEELRSEILAEKANTSLKSYVEANRHYRIKYDLLLIRRFQAYADAFDARIRYFEDGNETLRYLMQRVRDDIKIIETLEDMQVDELIARINRVLDELTPATTKPFIDATQLTFFSAEKIWDEIDPNH
jgi:chromosome segregation ATPase